MLKKVTIFSLFIINLLSVAHADAEWRLITDDNNIQVYIQKTDYSKILRSKCVSVINAPMKKIREKLDNINNRPNWVPFLKEAKAIIEYSADRRLEYGLFSAPWPASNRDFVYRLELISNFENQLIYKMASEYSDLMPEKKGVIRADLMESIYTLTALDENRTRVELIYHADPKGWLPNWIINIIQRILPYKILENLKEELAGN